MTEIKRKKRIKRILIHEMFTLKFCFSRIPEILIYQTYHIYVYYEIASEIFALSNKNSFSDFLGRTIISYHFFKS